MRARFFPVLLALLAALAAQAPLSLSAPSPAARPEEASRVPGRTSGPPAASLQVADLLAAGDQAYGARRYAAALQAYREALKSKGLPEARRPQVEYRVARCLGFTSQWDAALAEGARLLPRARGTVWEARLRAWLMEAYLTVPHRAWKAGERYYRTEEAPQTEAEAQPERVSLDDEDARKALQHGEAAKTAYEKLRAQPQGGGQPEEEAALAADLASLLSGTPLSAWAQGRRWKVPDDPVWKLDPDAAYDPAWAPPKKVLYLFAASEKLGTAKQKPLARLAQALWLRTYHGLMSAHAWTGDDPATRKPLPYPYQERQPGAVLGTFVKEFPTHPEAEHARLLLAQWLEADGKYDEALAGYQAFVKELPKSRWASDAGAGIARLTRLALSLEAPEPQPPGRKARLRVGARNVPKLRFSAHRVKLEEVVKDGRVLQRPREGIGELFARLGRIKGLRKFYGGDPVTWEASLVKEGDRSPVSKEIETPLTGNGAYVVEAEGGPVRAAVLLLVSDLAVLQIVDEEKAHAFVVNAATGAPVVEASTLIREVYTDEKEKAKVSAATAVTGVDGLAEKALAPGRQQSDDVLTFAWKGDRYAFTGGAYASAPDPEAAGATACVYTERPVYRPAQTVYYRALLAGRGEDGGWKALPGQKVRVKVKDPRGAEIESRELTAGEFGSVHAGFQLSPGAPLGAYGIAVLWGEGKEERERGSGTFRVEEYKKPEFQVSVRPAQEGPARVGEPLTAKVVARYYFGAPVANAKVKYTVTRSLWTPPSPFQEPHASLYPSLQEEDRTIGWRFTEAALPGKKPLDNGIWRYYHKEQVASGTATTDGSGEAAIKFGTAVKDPDLAGRHFTFSIQAEVTDASRRTIEGSGEVRALTSQFNAFLRLPQGFYSPGDRIQAEVRTQDAEGSPVSVSGTARILRLTAAKGADEEGRYAAEEVHAEPLRTDAGGRAVLAWTAPREGLYEVRFEALDAGERPVRASARAWVAGEGAGDGVLPRGHAFIVPERATYRPGETARVLVVTDAPGMTVLLTQEAGEKVLEKQVVRLSGRSQVVEIPLARRHSPDVTLAISGIRGRGLFRDRATLFVPPAEQLLSVEVTPDKAQYKPGERAVLRLRARDVEGRPVRTEASVGIVDSSLFYIQGDEGPSLATHFYAEERGSGLDAEGSLSESFDTAEENDQPPAKFELHDWRFPEGLGNLQTRVNPFFANSEFVQLRSQDAAALLNIGARQGVPELAANLPAGALPGPPGVTPAQLRSREILRLVQSGAIRLDELSGVPGFDAAAERARKAPVGAPLAPRSKFSDLALWTPAVVTDANGEATVEVQWPDNLTRWRATARAWTETAQVGEATADVETTKDLLVRLQAPRFFMERDELVLSANVHNYTDGPRSLRVRLELEGQTLVPAASSPLGPPVPRKLHVPRADRPVAGTERQRDGETERRRDGESGERRDASSAATDSAALEQVVEVPKGEERRVDWRVRVERPGEAKVRVVAEVDGGAGESDAVEMRFPVLVHGVEKLVSKSGSMLMAPGEKPGARTAKLSLDLPAERAPDAGELVVQLSPTAAGAMLDALPYLVEYPYGCTEQTLSRFMPAVVCRKTLTDLGVDLGDLQQRAEAEQRRLEESAALGTDREAARRELTRRAWRAQRSPVYHPAQMQAITEEGLARLRKFQHADGGWGWWEADASNGRMTAYVLQGLTAAKAAGLEAPPTVLQRGFAYLEKRFATDKEIHDVPLFGWVLTLDAKRAPAIGTALMERSFPLRAMLTPYSQALLALALKAAGRATEARACLQTLQETARVDREAGVCYWKKDDGASWNWYNNDVETAAACLRALNALEPKSPLAPMVVRWLCGHRAGESWNSTRETALAIQALAEYVRINRELAPEYTVTVEVGGGFKRSFKVDAENALLFDNRLVIPASGLGHGAQSISLTREGRGNLYYTAYLRYFTLEEGIQSAGKDLRVRRRYFRLTQPAEVPKGAPTTKDGYVRTLVRAGDRLASGDLLEVELHIENKFGYEYLVFEDMKPAGCEPVDLRSGARYGDDLCSNMELRDEKVAFFMTWLPAGRRLLTYRMRAEIPGTFHALPVSGYAMYAPEVRCLSDEGNFGIEDGER